MSILKKELYTSLDRIINHTAEISVFYEKEIISKWDIKDAKEIVDNQELSPDLSKLITVISNTSERQVLSIALFNSYVSGILEEVKDLINLEEMKNCVPKKTLDILDTLIKVSNKRVDLGIECFEKIKKDTK